MRSKNTKDKPYGYTPKFPDVELTSAQQEFKQQLIAASQNIENLEKDYARLRGTCKDHLFIPVMTDELRDGLRRHQVWTWSYDSATCEICRRYFGYRCPDSPDSVCHYFTTEIAGKLFVELYTGEKIPYLAENHNPTRETEDSCLFCHVPQERK